MSFYYSFMGDLKPKTEGMRIIGTFAVHKQFFIKDFFINCVVLVLTIFVKGRIQAGSKFW